MRSFSRVAGLMSLTALVGCGNAPRDIVADPSSITVESALVSVIRGLRMAEAEAQNGSKQSLGLNPCTVNVVFNITAGGTNKNELVLDANIKGGNAIIGGSGEVKDTLTNESTASRGNQISVLLTSTACLSKDTLAGTHPAEVGKVATEESAIRHTPGKTVYDFRMPKKLLLPE